MIALFFVSSVIFSVSTFVGDVFAWHDAGQMKWDTSNNAFLCRDNLNDIKHELFSPCAEARKAAQSWNDVEGSSWTLTYTHGDNAPIHLYSKSFESDDPAAGKTFLHHRDGKIVGADIEFNLDKPFTDVSHYKSNKNYHDFESIVFHEFGHLQAVGHSWLNLDSAMKKGLNPNTIRDKPEKHDIDVLKARYP